MYDSFMSNEIDECPAGHQLTNGYQSVTEYQTKALDNMLETYHIGDKIYVHGRRVQEERLWVYEWCHACDTMVGRWAIIRDDTFVGFDGPTEWEQQGGRESRGL